MPHAVATPVSEGPAMSVTAVATRAPPMGVAPAGEPGV
jgi:hypothetical protein